MDSDYQNKITHLLLITSEDTNLLACIRASFMRRMNRIILVIPENAPWRDKITMQARQYIGPAFQMEILSTPQTPDLMEIANSLADYISEEKEMGTVQVNVCLNNGNNALLLSAFIVCSISETEIFSSDSTENPWSGDDNTIEVTTLPRVPFFQPLRKRLYILKIIEKGVQSQNEVVEKLKELNPDGRHTKSGVSQQIMILERKGLLRSRKTERVKKLVLTDMGRLVLHFYEYIIEP